MVIVETMRGALKNWTIDPTKMVGNIDDITG